MFTAPDTTLRAAPSLTHTSAWFSGPAVPPSRHCLPAGSPVPLRHAAEDRITQGTEGSDEDLMCLWNYKLVKSEADSRRKFYSRLIVIISSVFFIFFVKMS